MEKLDVFEKDILTTLEAGEFKSTSPSEASLAKFEAAANATFIKARRFTIRRSSSDLMTMQARALEEGIPYRTFIRQCFAQGCR
jgi:predicted DNA binding CopG/RHH family protein